MRSRQLAILHVGALRGVRFACRRIADIERPVGPNHMHGHRQLARHGETGLAVKGAFVISWPQLLTLSLPFTHAIKPDAAS